VGIAAKHLVSVIGWSRWQWGVTDGRVWSQLNDVLSLGLHRVWKRAAVKWSGAVRGHTALDVCCGSGDLAFLLAEAVGAEGQVCYVPLDASATEYLKP